MLLPNCEMVILYLAGDPKGVFCQTWLNPRYPNTAFQDSRLLIAGWIMGRNGQGAAQILPRCDGDS